MTDFFISYARVDGSWAEWIAWQLEAAGYSTVNQAWDFRPGDNFVLDMQQAAAESDRTIAVLSPAYLQSDFTAAEWAAAFARDPTGTQGLLLPVRIQDCEPRGLLPQIVYIDLVGLEAKAARDTLLAGVRGLHARPTREPGFPGHSPSPGMKSPLFPSSIPPALKIYQIQVKSVVEAVRHKYDPILYVNRALEQQLNEFFESPLADASPHCYLLVAPAGSGKTNLLCHLARSYVTHRPVVLLMGGNLYLSSTTGLLDAIQSELTAATPDAGPRLVDDCLSQIKHLAQELNHDALIMLDAINEYEQPVQMRKALEHLLRITRGRHIKLVVTCRDYYWGLFKGSFWRGVTVNDLPNETDDSQATTETGDNFYHYRHGEHTQALNLYFNRYQIMGQLVGDAVEQCRHPLLLRFFCEAYRGQNIGEITDIRLKELFDQYWSRKLFWIAERMIQGGVARVQETLSAEVGDYLLTLAAYMLHHNTRAIPMNALAQATGHQEPLGDPHSTYGRIRDEYIILEEQVRGKGNWQTRQVAFVYEEFMEYVMAKFLLRNWEEANVSEEEILNEIEDLTGKYNSFAQILGVMIYLSLLLKEHRGLTLWPLLLSKGEQWQKIVFEAIRKLPTDQLDSSIFEMMTELLIDSDSTIQIQVLDTLKVKRVGQMAPKSLIARVCTLTVHGQEALARRAVLTLGNTEEDIALPALIKAVTDRRRNVRENAIKVLRQLGDVIVEPLIKAMRDADREVRQGEAVALGAALKRLDDVVVEPLIKALRDPDREARRGAADALGQLGDTQVVEPLIKVLGDTDREVRRGAANSLGQLGDTRAVEPLIKILEDADRWVQWGAANALRQLGDVAVEPLIKVLGDVGCGVRQEVAATLRQWVAVRKGV